jgi:hypothetical protein
MTARIPIAASFCYALAAAALAGAGAAKADPGASALTRAEVKAAVLAARASGELIPAGEASLPVSSRPGEGAFASRAEVKAAAMLAVRNGEMIPAGEGSPHFASSAGSTLSRADMHALVLRARAAGELIAAGEGERPSERQVVVLHARTRHEPRAEPIIAAR